MSKHGNNKRDKYSKIILTSLVVMLLILSVSEAVCIKKYQAENVRLTQERKDLQSTGNQVDQKNKEISKLNEQLAQEKSSLRQESEKNIFFKKMLEHIQDRQIFESKKHNLYLSAPKNWKLSPRDPEKLDTVAMLIKPKNQQNCGTQNKKTVCLDQINFGLKEFSIGPNFKTFLINEFGYPSDSLANLQKVDFKNKSAYYFDLVSAFDGTKNRNFWIQLDDKTLFYIKEQYLEESQKQVLDEIIENITL